MLCSIVLITGTAPKTAASNPRNKLDLSDSKSCINTVLDLKPDWIINTSCEHMDNTWFNTVDYDQLLIIQSNNSEEFEGHINTCDNLDEFNNKYPLKTEYMCGEMITPAYTRFMKIGFK